MPLTREQIIRREKEYFSSSIASEPAYISASEYSDEDFEYEEEKCVYQTEDGRKCAVGLLFKDGQYDPRFDDDAGTSVTGLPDNILNYLGVENIEFLGQLQTFHDDNARQWYSEGIHDHFGKWLLEKMKSRWPSKFNPTV